jgi:hypothetical protein
MWVGGDVSDTPVYNYRPRVVQMSALYQTDYPLSDGLHRVTGGKLCVDPMRNTSIWMKYSFLWVTELLFIFALSVLGSLLGLLFVTVGIFATDVASGTVGNETGAVTLRVKRDLEKFKAYIESRGRETGAWRGTVKPS